MISTHGLTHLALAVRDPDRSLCDPDGYEMEIWFE
jgi:hypothetical protein